MECNLGNHRPQVQYQRVAENDAGMRLDNYLLRELAGVPRSYVYRIIRSGEVRINKGRAKPGSRLAEHDDVRIPPVRTSNKAGPGRPPDGLLEKVGGAIVLETPDWLLFNKPPGLPVHAGTGQRFGLIEVLRAARPDETLELVHRLDRDTSGCLLVARNRKTLNALRDALRSSGARKHYLALLAGRWQGGPREVDAPVVRDVERSGERMVEVDRESDFSKSALSTFTPQSVFERHVPPSSLLDVRIHTGRTHQIRVHAAHIGHPVAGDDKYGDRAFNKRYKNLGLNRTFLHAWRLQLPALDEGGQPINLEAPLPTDLENVLAQLKAEQ